MNSSSEKFYPLNEVVTKLKFNYFIKFFTLGFLHFIIYWSLGFGLIILLFRLLDFQNVSFSFYFIGFILAIFYSYNFALYHKFSDKKCFAFIDAYNEAGGLLLSEIELNDNSWERLRKKVFKIPNLELDFNYNQLINYLLISIIFVILSCCVPLPKSNFIGNKKIDLSQKVDELKEQISILEEEDIINEEEKVKLEKSLEDIVKNSDKETPGITFESLDQMSDKLKYEASTDVKKRITDLEILKKLENYVKEAQKAANDEKKARELLENLKNSLRKSGMSEAQINDFLEKQFGKELGQNGLTSRQAANQSKKINQKLQKKLMENSELSEKLKKQNLLDNETLNKIQESLSNNESENNRNDENSFFDITNDDNNTENSLKNGSGENTENGSNNSKNGSGDGSGENTENGSNNSKNGSGDDSGENTENGSNNSENGSGNGSGENSENGSNNSGNGLENGSGESLGNGSDNSENGLGNGSGDGSGESSDNGSGNGAGGVGKGGGKTPLTFGDKASEHNAKFHDEALPEVKEESAFDSISVGIGIASPNVNKDKDNYNVSNFGNIKKSGNKSYNNNLLPKYRNTVKNYFNH